MLLLRVGGNGWREVSFISRICKNSDGTTRGYACSCVPRISFVRGRSSISPLRFVYRRPSPPVSEYPRSDRVAQSIDRSGFAPSTLSPRNRDVLETHDGRRRRRRVKKVKDLAGEPSIVLIYRSITKYPIVRPVYCPVPSRPPSLLPFPFRLLSHVVICANNSIIIKSLVLVIMYIFDTTFVEREQPVFSIKSKGAIRRVQIYIGADRRW